MREQTNGCFAACCPVQIAGGDPLQWIKAEQYGWVSELDRWFCPQHLAAWKTLYRDLELAVLTFHSLTVMLAAAPPRLQERYFDECQRAEARVGVLRMIERDLRGE